MATKFVGVVQELSSAVCEEMRGRSWHPDPACPAFAELRLLRVSHHDFAGGVQLGELVVNAQVADEVVAIFEQLFAHGFAIERMQRVDAYAGDDARSMAANNSSAFNFRRVQGTQVLSHHALGLAIDINPLQNPWVRGERVDPLAGRDYLDRAHVRPGMIVRSGPVIAAFAECGWYWGGDFHDMQDYHHFSKLPRGT